MQTILGHSAQRLHQQMRCFTSLKLAQYEHFLSVSRSLLLTDGSGHHGPGLRCVRYYPRGGNAHLPTTNELRSEEHTSELQSRFDLVCRLLREKKKKSI